MYTRCTEAEVKEKIMRSFCDPHGRMRLVIATIAFGMGLDCHNVRQILHWGPASNIESFVQETGRAGRDGYVLYSALFFKLADKPFCSSALQTYCENKSVCRRVLLFEEFDDSSSMVCNACF